MLIKAFLWLLWSLFLEMVQISWGIWKDAYATFKFPADPENRHVGTGKILLCSVFVSDAQKNFGT